MIPVLHIHGQHFWHSAAIIVGNRAGLTELKLAIEAALANESHAMGKVFVADGEGYTIGVKVRDLPIGAEEWQRALLPYIDEIAGGDRKSEV